MGNNKDPNKTRPGEMPPGTFHYNPGNMSGKTIGKAERDENDVAPNDLAPNVVVPTDQGGDRPKQKAPSK